MRGARLSMRALVGVVSITACSVRVGNSSPGGTSQTDGGLEGDPSSAAVNGGSSGALGSACARVGNDARVPAGTGTDDFALVWDGDHYMVAYIDRAAGNGDVYTLALNPDGTTRGAPHVIESTPAAS